MGRQYGKCSGNDKVVMAASGLQSESALRAGLENELSKLPAQKLAAGRLHGDSQVLRSSWRRRAAGSATTCQ